MILLGMSIGGSRRMISAGQRCAIRAVVDQMTEFPYCQRAHRTR
jgi:hypothetical protein